MEIEFILDKYLNYSYYYYIIDRSLGGATGLPCNATDFSKIKSSNEKRKLAYFLTGDDEICNVATFCYSMWFY